MASTTFLVGVLWPSFTSPAIGYSNYNRPCDRNWTQYSALEDWVLNSDRDPLFDELDPNRCNWPMLRVNVEERHEALECGG